MNYYERYVGDFQRDTGHLSCTEVGVYDRFLDHYYATEQPLPAEYSDLCRIARAMDKAEQKAVKRVADDFFPVAEDGLRHNSRADHEIQKAQNRINAAKENGKKGGRKPKQTGIEPTGFPTGSPAETHPGVHHMPDPSSSISEQTAAASNTANGNSTDSPPSRSDSIAKNLVAQGIQAGQVAKNRERIDTWAQAGVTDGQIESAIQVAKQRRADAGDKSPINIGFIDSILTDLQAKPASAVAATPYANVTRACTVCGGVGSWAIGSTWYCSQHDQHSEKAA